MSIKGSILTLGWSSKTQQQDSKGAANQRICGALENILTKLVLLLHELVCGGAISNDVYTTLKSADSNGGLA